MKYQKTRKQLVLILISNPLSHLTSTSHNTQLSQVPTQRTFEFRIRRKLKKEIKSNTWNSACNSSWAVDFKIWRNKSSCTLNWDLLFGFLVRLFSFYLQLKLLFSPNLHSCTLKFVFCSQNYDKICIRYDKSGELQYLDIVNSTSSSTFTCNSRRSSHFSTKLDDSFEMFHCFHSSYCSLLLW